MTANEAVIESLDLCERCDGTGEIEELAHVSGDDLIPGGFYEGSGKYRTCECRL